ncbi:MAG: OB-fold nucleic acid binding domain-containing protein [Candidatus Aenigmarchaeota archaeon]|nr:OB-fold nucleic acid binding domain-containing protein [Candidatus Aenigmarchaeota archaeon]
MIDDIVEKISASSKISKDEINKLIDEKLLEFSGLISEEGAAYLVAKELDVEIKREEERLNIQSVMPGMQNVDVTGKITRISPIKEFKTEKAEGRVSNIIIADKTGSVRMSLWNDEIEKLTNLEVGDVVNIRGYVKDNMGQPEIRLGRKGLIAKMEDKGEFDNVVKYERIAERSHIKDLSENIYRSVRAPLLQVFESNIFYEICPECKKRAKEQEDGFYCAEHGLVNQDYGLIISGIIDDGTASIRVVFFNETAEKIIGMNKTDAKKLFDKKKKVEAITSLIPLGKEFIFEGTVRRNNFFDRLEFIVNTVKQVDVKKEIDMLMKDVE